MGTYVKQQFAMAKSKIKYRSESLDMREIIVLAWERKISKFF